MSKSSKAMRFHWRLLQPGSYTVSPSTSRLTEGASLPAIEAQTAFCRCAEASGIDSVLVDLNLAKPEPTLLALALAQRTSRLTFMVAHRAGLMSPTLFVQMVNTFSALSNGRISLNMVAGHSPAEQRSYGDHLTHEERYRRLDEYLDISIRLWSDTGEVTHESERYTIVNGAPKTPFVSAHARRPEIYLGGGSAAARRLAMARADCWLRFADAPEIIRREAEEVISGGTQVGLRLSVIARETRQQALDAAHALVAGKPVQQRRQDEGNFVAGSDSVSIRGAYALGEKEWLAPYLWAGAVRVFGAPAVCLLGSYDDVAEGIRELANIGVSQLIVTGWPSLAEMKRFGEVIPRVRQLEMRTR